VKRPLHLLAALISVSSGALAGGAEAWAHGMVFPTTPREVIEAKPDTVSHTGYLAY
jgi:hypothetical protein